MIVRKQIVKNKDGTTRTYLLLVEAYREKGKVKQHFLANLGRVDDPQTALNVDRLMEKLKVFALKQQVIDMGKDLLAEDAKLYGPLVIFRRLWNQLQIGSVLEEALHQGHVETEFHEAIFCMVLNRLLNPESKRGTFFWKDTVYEPAWDSLDLQHLYRAMDFLEKRASDLEHQLSQRFLNLCNLDLDLVLMDTTTVMYDGEGDESELLKHGYSRDKRPDLKQVVVAVAMTKQGFPLACEIFAGNVSDRKSFPELWKKIRARFPAIKRLIIVCDRGSISEKNLKDLDDLKLDYIVGVRMRSLEEEKRLKLLSDSGFHPVSEDAELEVKEKTYVNEDGQKRRYIVALNRNEAKYEKAKREAFRKILDQKVAKRTLKEWVVKNGFKKYVKFTKGSEIVVDEARLDKEEIYDGKWVLLTSTEFSAKDVALHYKGLAIVERGFRSMKSDFKVHPVFHRVSRRIRAHVFLCFLALVLKQYFRWLLAEQAQKTQTMPPSYTELMRDLEQLRAIDLKVGEKHWVLRTELQGQSHLAFAALKMQPPARVLEAGVKKTPKPKPIEKFQQMSLV